MVTVNVFSLDPPSIQFFSPLSMLDLGGRVCSVSGPTNLGGCFCVSWRSRQDGPLFPVPWGGGVADNLRRHQKIVDPRGQGDVSLAVFVVATRLWALFLHLGVSLTWQIVLSARVQAVLLLTCNGVLSVAIVAKLAEVLFRRWFEYLRKDSTMAASCPGRWSNWILAWWIANRSIQY